LASITLEDVTIEFPIYDARTRSMKNRLLGLGTRGRIGVDRGSVHVRALRNVSLTLSDGDRVGLVGRNGAGKSTLLALIRGAAQPDAGTIRLPRGDRIGFLAQEAPGGADNALATVLAADEERTALLTERDAGAAPLRIGEIEARLNDIDAHTAPSRAARILAGLGLDAAMQERPLNELSGGWRMRVALAAVLFAEPDLLLLDEPTNHLDLEASLWLERFLRLYRHSVILVSHDMTGGATCCTRGLLREGGRVALVGVDDDVVNR